MCWWVGGEGPSRPRAKAASPVLISKLPEREDQKEVGVFHKMLARLRQARGSSRRKSLIHSFIQPENNDRVLSLMPGTVQGHPGVDEDPVLKSVLAYQSILELGITGKEAGCLREHSPGFPGSGHSQGRRVSRGPGAYGGPESRWLTLEGGSQWKETLWEEEVCSR